MSGLRYFTLNPGLGDDFSSKQYDAAWALRQPWMSDTGVVYEQRSGLGTARATQPRRAMLFNGTNQYLTYTLPNPIDTFPFTVFGWLKQSALVTQYLCGLSSTSSTDQYFSINPQRTGPTFRVARANVSFSTLDHAVTDYSGTWHSYLVTFLSDTSYTIYVDGILLSAHTGLASIPAPSLTSFVVSTLRRGSPTGYLSGYAQHCGYLRRAATLADAEALHTTGVIPNAAGLFTLDGNSTTVAYNIGTEGFPFSRTNLLTWTEDFSNADWTNVGTTDTASSLTEDSATSEHRLQNTTAIAVSSGVTYTTSAEFKANGRTRIRLGFDDTITMPGRAFFTLSGSGSVDNILAGTVSATITDVGDGWYRCKVTATSSSATSRKIEINLVSTGTTVNYAGDNVSGALLRNANWSVGDQPYQKITIGTYTTEATIVNGAAGLLYTGRDVPFSRQNTVGYSPVRNLGTYTEDLTNATHRKLEVTCTADKIVETAATSEHRVDSLTQFAVTTGQVWSIRMSAKASERSRIRLGFDSLGILNARAFFDLSNGTVDNTIAGATYSITPDTALGAGWYVCSITATAIGSGNVRREINLVSTGTTVSYLGDITKGAFVTKLQRALGAASDYQKIVADPGTVALFPAMLSNPTVSAATDTLQFAGVAPFDAQLESSNCFTFDGVDDYISLDLSSISGPELLTNGTFNSDVSSWVANTAAIVTWNAGRMRIERVSGTADRASQAITTIVGRVYLLKVGYSNFISGAGTGATVRAGTTGTGIQTLNTVNVSTGSKITFTATTTTTHISFGVNGNGIVELDDLSLTLLPGADTESLSSNVVASNPGFDTDTVWSKTLTTISGGTANWAGVIGNVTQNSLLVLGRKYKVTFTVSAYVSGEVYFRDGTNNYIGPCNANGVWSGYIYATGNSVGINSFVSSTLSVDDVSVQLVNEINKSGAATLYYRYEGDGFTGRSGTAYKIQFGSVGLIPCSEGAGAEVHDAIRDVAYSIVNGQASNWTTLQNAYHYNLENGFSDPLQQLDPALSINMSHRVDANWTDNLDGTYTSNGGIGFVGHQTGTGMTVGQRYQVVFEVLVCNSGQVRPQSATHSGGSYVSSVGVFTQYITPGSSSFYLYSSSFNGRARLLSLRRVPAHQDSRVPASQTNLGFDALGNLLSNPAVVGLNAAESKINFSPVANSWPSQYSIPGADIATYAFDGNSGSIEVRVQQPKQEAKFVLRKA